MRKFGGDKPQPYEVTWKDCQGCVYFGIVTGGGTRCCEYYYRTGQHRQDESTVKHCAEKKVGTKRERLETVRYEFGSLTRHKFY